MNLKELRLYHWQEAMNARKRGIKLDKRLADNNFRHRMELQRLQNEQSKAHALADFHIGCVQCLNDYLPGTAEQDVIEEKQQ